MYNSGRVVFSFTIVLKLRFNSAFTFVCFHDCSFYGRASKEMIINIDI